MIVKVRVKDLNETIKNYPFCLRDDISETENHIDEKNRFKEQDFLFLKIFHLLIENHYLRSFPNFNRF